MLFQPAEVAAQLLQRRVAVVVQIAPVDVSAGGSEEGVERGEGELADVFAGRGGAGRDFAYNVLPEDAVEGFVGGLDFGDAGSKVFPGKD